MFVDPTTIAVADTIPVESVVPTMVTYEAIYRELLPTNECFNYGDILCLLSSRPDIAAINSPPSP